MEHPHIGLEDLAGPWIVDVWPKGIGDARGEPAHGGVARVLRVPIRILLGRRRQLADDSLLEARLFEGRLPGLDAGDDVRLPLCRNFTADIPHDRLEGLGEGGFGVLLLESPASDVADALDLVLGVVAVVREIDVEETHPVVFDARLHGLLGELDHAVVQDHRDTALRRIAARLGRKPRPVAVLARCGLLELVGRQHPGLDVAGKGLHLFDEGPVVVQTFGLDRLRGAELALIGDEEVRDLDHRRLVLAVGGDVEDLDDRRHRGRLDRDRNRILDIGADFVLDVAQQHAISTALPAHDPVANRHAGPRVAGLGRRDLGHPDHVLAELGGRDLEVDLVVFAMDGEKAFVGGHLVADDVFVGLRALLVLLVLVAVLGLGLGFGLGVLGLGLLAQKRGAGEQCGHQNRQPGAARHSLHLVSS